MAKETEIKNAIISSVSLDTGDRGLLTGWLNLDYGGSGQGFGGHCLYLPKSFTHHTEKGDYNFQTENWIYQACGSYPTHWLKKATTPIVEGYSEIDIEKAFDAGADWKGYYDNRYDGAKWHPDKTKYLSSITK